MHQTTDGIELLQAELTTVHSLVPIHLTCVYRSPASSLSLFWTKLQAALAQPCSGATVVMGDLNIDLTSPAAGGTPRLTAMMTTARFAEAVQRPTFRAGSQLDHTWTSGCSVVSSGAVMSYISDHAAGVGDCNMTHTARPLARPTWTAVHRCSCSALLHLQTQPVWQH